MAHKCLPKYHSMVDETKPVDMAYGSTVRTEIYTLEPKASFDSKLRTRLNEPK